MREWGISLYYGDYNNHYENRKELGIEWLKKAAEKGDEKAKVHLNLIKDAKNKRNTN